MDPQNHYRTLSFNHDFGFKQYITPHMTCDPKKQILDRQWADYKHKRKQGKFKVTTKPKVSYFDELVKPIKDLPGPKYKVEGDMIRRSKSLSIKKIQVDLKTKKDNYIDQMEQYDKRHKPPGVGKFDLTKYTSIKKQKGSPAKQARQNVRVKNNNFDDGIKVAAQLPGPGQFNPHLNVQKIKKERMSYKDWQDKHQQQQKKLTRSVSAKLGPFTYNPILPGTFSSKAADKSIPISRWSHGTIEIRKGLRSQYKDPSPSEYNTVHQWVKSGEKDKKIGNFNLMNRVSTARSFSVYH